MNHCFQSLTGSFFPSFSFPVCCLFLFLSLSTFFSHFALPFLFLSSSSFFSRLSFVLSGFVRLSHTSPGTKVEGDVFMIVNIFMVLSSAWFCSPSCPKGNQACSFFFFLVTQSRFRYVDYSFLVMEVGQVLFRMSVCMHEKQRQRQV